MKQPFDLKYIRRYILLYIGVVVGMVVFYFLNSSTNPSQSVEKKEFSTTVPAVEEEPKTVEKVNNHGIKLLERGRY
jgi:uncharacterized membrane-anchored protein YhcB (DUF1043 family)